MTDAPQAPRGVPGRKLVPVGLALVLLTFITLMVLFRSGPKGQFTGDAAGPRGAVKARIEAKCGKSSATWSGRCSTTELLTVTLETEAPEARYVTWAMFGQGGSLVRSSPVGTPVEIRLEELPGGPYMLAAVVGDAALDTKGLAQRFGGPGAPVDPIRGLDTVEGFANDARKAGRVATVTRLPLQLDAPPEGAGEAPGAR